jgi:histidinol-phosphate/aromatic aminotransferase/cobyric acid decarboxylase-like protein
MATFDDLERVEANVARLIAERERLTEALRDVPWLDPLPSDTNFILIRVEGQDPEGVVEGLAERGILIRDFSSPAMAGYVRVSVGRPDQNDVLIAALEGMT